MPYRSSGTSGKHAPTVGTHAVAAAIRIDADPRAGLAKGASTRLSLLQSIQSLIPTLSDRFAADIGALTGTVGATTTARAAPCANPTVLLQRCRHTLADIQRTLAGMAPADGAQADPAETSQSIAPKDQRALSDACDLAFDEIAQLCRHAESNATSAERDSQALAACSAAAAMMASLMLALRTASGDERSLPTIAMAAVALRVGMAGLGVAGMLCEGEGPDHEPYAGYDGHRQHLQEMVRSAKERLRGQELGAERDPDTMAHVSGIARVVRDNIDTLTAEERQAAFDAVPGADGEPGPTVHALFLNQRLPEALPAPRVAVKPGSAP